MKSNSETQSEKIGHQSSGVLASKPADVSYQVQHGPHRVGNQWLDGWQIVTKIGRYVATVAHLRDVDAAIARATGAQ